MSQGQTAQTGASSLSCVHQGGTALCMQDRPLARILSSRTNKASSSMSTARLDP